MSAQTKQDLKMIFTILFLTSYVAMLHIVLWQNFDGYANFVMGM